MFEMPKITAIKFAVEDVITVSGGNGSGNGNVDLPEEEL